MTTLDDLKGFCYPLTPGGISSLVGELPWHYATDYLNIAYRADPQAIAARLPEPLAPGPEPDMAYVAFSKWWPLWGRPAGYGLRESRAHPLSGVRDLGGLLI